MRRIAIINQKGGVGKTTTTVNVGAALARKGYRVLMVDLDPQAHLSLHFGLDLDTIRSSVYDLLLGSATIARARLKAGANLWLVPSSIDLAGAEIELVNTVGREVILRDLLDQHVANNGRSPHYDYVLMDCPPSLSVLTLNGLCAAHEVMIPLQPHYLALQGLSKLLETVSLVSKRINPGLVVSGVALCMHEQGTRLAGEVVEDVRAFFESARGTQVPWADTRVFDTVIRRNIKLAEAPSYGQSIFDYAPDSNGAKDYESLSREIDGLPTAHASAEARPGHKSAPTPDATQEGRESSRESSTTAATVSAGQHSDPSPDNTPENTASRTHEDRGTEVTADRKDTADHDEKHPNQPSAEHETSAEEPEPPAPSESPTRHTTGVSPVTG